MSENTPAAPTAAQSNSKSLYWKIGFICSSPGIIISVLISALLYLLVLVSMASIPAMITIACLAAISSYITFSPIRILIAGKKAGKVLTAKAAYSAIALSLIVPAATFVPALLLSGLGD